MNNTTTLFRSTILPLCLFLMLFPHLVSAQFNIIRPVQGGIVKGNSNGNQSLVQPPVTLDLGSDLKVCPNDITYLDAGAGFISYQWSTGATTQSIQVMSPGVYLCDAIDTGGDLHRDTVEVAFKPGVSASYSFSVNGQTAQFTDLSFGQNQVFWDFGDGNFGYGSFPSHTYLSSGTFEVCVIAIGACDTSYDCQIVNVPPASLKSGSANVYPNPSINGALRVQLEGETPVSVSIFDFSGRKVVVAESFELQSASVDFDLSGYHPGLYLIEVIYPSGREVIRVKIGQ